MGGIKTAHRERTRFVHSSKKETHDLLTEYRGLLKEMAEDLKNFLAKSESSRKSDFKALMENIHSRVKEVRVNGHEFMAQVQKELKDMAQDLKKFLAESEDTRKADFAATMKEVENAVSSIRSEVKAEQKEAAGHWASLLKRETPSEKAEEAAEAAEAHAPAHKKRSKKSKAIKL